VSSLETETFLSSPKYATKWLSVLGNLLPENIESLDVVKGEKALKEYNAPNGVIIIKRRKIKSNFNYKKNFRPHRFSKPVRSFRRVLFIFQ